MKTDNQIIAEFMGYEWLGEGYHDGSDHNFSQGIKDYEGDIVEARFHESWDWLMPVVEKIEKIGSTIVIISKATCQIQPIIYDKETDSMKWHGPFETVGTEKLKFTYETIVRFIKWYNIQNS